MLEKIKRACNYTHLVLQLDITELSGCVDHNIRGKKVQEIGMTMIFLA